MTGGECLLDTGPIVALIRRDDHHHAEADAFFRGFQGVFLSNEAVLTEALHLLPAGQGRERAFEFILRGYVALIPTTRPRLERCRSLMAQYADLPMDFADATLVALAAETGIRRVATFDRRGFSVYRARGRPLDVSP